MSKSRVMFTRSRATFESKLFLALLALWASWAGSTAAAGVFITEFNSTSNVGNNEFVEFTNTGNTPQDMTGWSEDDSTATANKAGHSLSAFGILQPHESAIFTEATPDGFRAFWWGSVAAAPAGLKIIGPYSNDNLSSSADSVTLFNAAAQLVDRIDYPGAPAAGSGNGVTRDPSSDAFLGLLGATKNSHWVDSTIGDIFGSFRASGNTALIGNPGSYPFTAAPEPATWTLGLLGGGLAGLAAFNRRRARRRARVADLPATV